MNEQFKTESENDISLDKSAHFTGKILSELFSFGETDENKEKTAQFGYQLGRVVYFLDAFDDYEKDKKKILLIRLKTAKTLLMMQREQ